MQTDVVIVGAGPSGIFTALEMIKRGTKQRIVIVEKGLAVEQRRGDATGDHDEPVGPLQDLVQPVADPHH